jgi:WD40 repeat protein
MKARLSSQPRRHLLSVLVAASVLITAVLAIVINLATSLVPESWQKWRFYPLLVLAAAVSLVLVAALLAIAIQRKSEHVDESGQCSPLAETPWMIPVRTRAFIRRPEIVDHILSVLAAPVDPMSPLLIALIGAGGFGKTTIAQEIGRLPQVRRRYPGGLLWITVGNASGPDLASRIGFLAEQLGAERLAEPDPDQAGIRLAAILSRCRPSLLIIDDVWTKDQLFPFLHGGLSCTRLITTRVADIIPAAGIRISVDEMSIAQSAELLMAGSSYISMNIVEPLLRVTGRWPLLLAMISGLMADLIVEGSSTADAIATYLSMLNKSGPAGLDQLSSDGGKENLVAATMEASLSRLTPDYRERFVELGIFPREIEIPRNAITRLWHATAGMQPEDADALCHRLFALSLLSSYKINSARVHDVVRSYLRSRDKFVLAKTNNKFIDEARLLLEAGRAYPRETPMTSWWLLPENETYLWENLVFHLKEAGRMQELVRTVQDLRWIRRRIQRGSTVDAEADLNYSDQAKARTLRSQLASYSHLLRPVGGSRDVTTGLANYVGRPLALDLDIKTLLEEREAGCLRPLWAVPEISATPATRVFGAHSESMNTVAVSPDGTWICAGSQDGSICIWNRATGSLRYKLLANDSPISAVDFSPDGTWLASGSADGAVRIWNPQSGELRGVLSGHKDRVTAVRFFGDNNSVATVSYDGTMRIWGIADCVEHQVWFLEGLLQRAIRKMGRLASYEPRTAALSALALAPDNSWIAVGTFSQGIRIIDVRTGKICSPVEGKREVLDALAVSPDGSKLAAGWGTGYPRYGGSPLSIYDLTGDSPSTDYWGHEGSIGCIQFSPDGQWIATAGQDATVRLWNSSTGLNYATLRDIARGISDLAVSPDGQWLVTACWDGTVRILRVVGDVEKYQNKSPNFLVLATSPDDTWVAASGNGISEIRRLPTGKILSSFEAWGDAMIADPRGRWLAAAHHQLVLIVPLRKGLRPLRLTHNGSVRTMATAADGSWIAAAGEDSTIRVWNVPTGEILAVLHGHTDRIAQICLIPGTTSIASASMDGTVRIWDVNGAADCVILEGHGSWVTALAVSPDSTWLASGSDDKTARIWNLRDYTLRTILRGHSDNVRELASAPDGAWVASGGFDNTVRIWDTLDGTSRKVLRGHTKWIQSIAVSPNGQWIATSGWDYTLRVWDVNTGSCDASFRSEDLIRACSWLSNGRILAAAGRSGIYLWSYLCPKLCDPGAGQNRDASESEGKLGG